MARKIFSASAIFVIVCVLASAFAYSLYIDFPSLDGPAEIRFCLPEEYSIEEAELFHTTVRALMIDFTRYYTQEDRYCIPNSF